MRISESDFRGTGDDFVKKCDVGKITRSEAEAEIERLSKINTDWFDVILKQIFLRIILSLFPGNGKESVLCYIELPEDEWYRADKCV